MFVRLKERSLCAHNQEAGTSHGQRWPRLIASRLAVCAMLCTCGIGTASAEEIRIFEPRLEPRILKNSATQKCLQIARFSTLRAGQQAEVASCTHRANTDGVLGETWIIEKSETYAWRIKARRDNWCLAVEENEDSQAGMPVSWRPCNSISNQAWRFVDVLEGDHPARHLRNSKTGRCLTASRNESFPKLYAARCEDGSGKLWDPSSAQLWDPSPVRVAAAILGRGVVELNLNDPKFPGVDRVHVRVKPDGSAVGFGDMILGKVEGGRIVTHQSPAVVYSPYRAEVPCAETAPGVGVNCSALSTDGDTRLWPGGVIPYSFNYCNGNGNDLEISRRAINPDDSDEIRSSADVVRTAIAYLNENTVLQFREQSGVNDRADRDPPNILNFCYGGLGPMVAGVSSVGFTGIRNQPILFARPEDLGFGNEFDLVAERTVYHEVLHAIGFIHEHQRPDRDQNISINFDNLPDSDLVRDNFGIKTEARSVTPYDVSSVMHYTNRNAFALDPDVPIFARRPSSFGATLGLGSREPTARDIDAINILYAEEAEGALPDLRGHRTMTLTINNISSDDTDGNWGRRVAIDYYSEVEMGAGWRWRASSSANSTDKYRSGQIEEDDNDVSPNWTFETLLPANRSRGKIIIRIRDDDGIWGDEDVDINPYPGQKFVELLVSTYDDAVFFAAPNGGYDSNGRLGDIGVPLSIMEGMEGDIKGQIVFTVDVSAAP